MSKFSLVLSTELSKNHLVNAENQKWERERLRLTTRRGKTLKRTLEEKGMILKLKRTFIIFITTFIIIITATTTIIVVIIISKRFKKIPWPL
jgi:lipopolysaccharide/colanic/teichoic acid biosynthesis glycosyltransferase